MFKIGNVLSETVAAALFKTFFLLNNFKVLTVLVVFSFPEFLVFFLVFSI